MMIMYPVQNESTHRPERDTLLGGSRGAMRTICTATVRLLATALLLMSLGCGGGEEPFDLDIDLQSVAYIARHNAGGTNPDDHADFRFPTAGDIRNIQDQGTLHLTADSDTTAIGLRPSTSMGAIPSCAGGKCPHLDSIRRIIPGNSVGVMRTGRGIDMVAGYRTAREDTFHLFYGAWMEHGFFGVQREETWFDEYIETLQTGFASIVLSGRPPTGDARYSGTMFAASPRDWDEAGHQGDADLSFHLDTNTLDVEFSGIVTLDDGLSRGKLSWLGLSVAADGTFSGTGDGSSCEATFGFGCAGPLRGAFAGPGSEEVMGVFIAANLGGWLDIPGAFGARRVQENAP